MNIINDDEGLNQRLIDKKLNQRADQRAANGGLFGGQRTVRTDKTVYFDGHTYFSLALNYYQRQRVWIEYSDGNWVKAVNIYTDNGPYRRLICRIDDRVK